MVVADDPGHVPASPSGCVEGSFTVYHLAMDKPKPFARQRLEALDAVSLNPHAAYIWGKLVDQDPREGTTLIMGKRVSTFCDFRQRQFFYEPLSSYDSILRSEQRMWQISQGTWLQNHQRDHVAIHFDVFESAYAAPHGRISFPTPGERGLGGHAVLVTGWTDSGDSLMFVNSWGAGWGDRGFGSVSRGYLDRYLRDAYLSRNARYGYTSRDYDALARATTAREIGQTWTRENPRWRYWIKHRGLRLRLYLYETYSFEDDAPVDVIEVRTGEDQRIGWAILFHEQDRVSVLKELFVWPTWRRHGIGTLLEKAAVSEARKWHASAIKLYFHTADARPGPRIAGRTFGPSAGYEWHWRRSYYPYLAAIGVKAV